MKRVAFIFPGQGAQYPGMGREVAEAYQASRQVLDRASLGLGRDVRRIAWDSTADQLADTANAQPAILAVSLATLAPLVEAGVRPAAMAGLSLGEYTALVGAGSLDLGDAMRLVSVRARLMQEAVPKGQGAMAAVIGLPRAEVVRACSDSSGYGIVEPANFNAPDQIVISGHTEAVRAAADAAKRAGARKVIPLAVTAPFHCSLLRTVEVQFAQALAGAVVGRPMVPVIANASARPSQEPDEIRRSLLVQISSPVLWEDSVRYMFDEMGISIFIEVGPGRVLTRFVNRIEPQATTINVEGPETIQACIDELSRLGAIAAAAGA
ncbi:MAG: ACP S-malonyltransferase [Bacillota bacterium]|nr:ACP S-malonyltransferase [Bacillota bacterium]